MYKFVLELDKENYNDYNKTIHLSLFHGSAPLSYYYPILYIWCKDIPKSSDIVLARWNPLKLSFVVTIVNTTTPKSQLN